MTELGWIIGKYSPLRKLIKDKYHIDLPYSIKAYTFRCMIVAMHDKLLLLWNHKKHWIKVYVLFRTEADESTQ